MHQGDRLDSASSTTEEESCTREGHEELKRNKRKFRRATSLVGVHAKGKPAEHELRNCRSCGSTLTLPRVKRRRSPS